MCLTWPCRSSIHPSSFPHLTLYGSGTDQCSLLFQDSDISWFPAGISSRRTMTENCSEGRKRRNQGHSLLLWGGVSGCGCISSWTVASARQILHSCSFCWFPPKPMGPFSPLCSASLGWYCFSPVANSCFPHTFLFGFSSFVTCVIKFLN